MAVGNCFCGAQRCERAAKRVSGEDGCIVGVVSFRQHIQNYGPKNKLLQVTKQILSAVC